MVHSSTRIHAIGPSDALMPCNDLIRLPGLRQSPWGTNKSR